MNPITNPNSIHLGDIIELFKEVPDDSIDITFADPPFNLNKKYGSSNDKRKLNDYLEWCDFWIREMARVTKPGGSIFVHNIPKWLTYYTKTLNDVATFKHWISWDAPTAPMGKTLQPSHYGILFYTKNSQPLKFSEIRYRHKRCRKCNYLQKDYGGKKEGLHPFGPLVSDVWTDIHRVKHNKYRDNHPCQLPIHLLERLILMSTEEGDIVLDPFMGTGTTALAAKRLGRKYIGFELDENYINIAKEKLSVEMPNSKLGSIWISCFAGEIVTIRNKDWPELEEFFNIPQNHKSIDPTEISLKDYKIIDDSIIHK